jgi:hypothetical protein
MLVSFYSPLLKLPRSHLFCHDHIVGLIFQLFNWFSFYVRHCLLYSQIRHFCPCNVLEAQLGFIR